MKRPSLNHTYRLVWNAVRQCWMVAPEIARSRGKSGGRVKPLAAAVAVALGLVGQTAVWADSCTVVGTTTISGSTTDSCQLVAGESLVVSSSGQIDVGLTASDAVLVVAPNTAGSIENSGLIRRTGNTGIQIQNGATLAGGLVNYSTGRIEGGYGIWVGGTLQNGLINYGVISGTETSAGALSVWNGSVQGGISNTGQIDGATSGLHVENAAIDGWIFNGVGGTISGASDNALFVSNSTIDRIVNQGDMSGNNGALVLLNGSTISSGIENTGTIQGTTGIFMWSSSILGGITNSGQINGQAFGVYLSSADVQGGITNQAGGMIQASDGGLVISNSSVTDGIINDGMIETTSTSGGRGIKIEAGGSLSGGITNNGTISAYGHGIEIIGAPGGVTSMVSGGIVNNGGIGASDAGWGDESAIRIADGGILNDGITNTGLLQGRGYGINLRYLGTLNGDIVNSGTITGVNRVGIYVDGDLVGNIVNQAGGTIEGGAEGIYVSETQVDGGITNAGTITGSGSTDAAIAIQSTSTLTGAITNSGQINGVGRGLIVLNSDIQGGITNQAGGTINATTFNALHVQSSTVDGITNHGTIDGAGAALAILGTSTISSGIVNTGTIAGATGVFVSYSQVVGGLTNSGEISGSGTDRYAVYDLDGSLDSITIEGNDTALFNRVVHAPNTPLTVASGATFSPIAMNRFEVQSFTNDGTLNLIAGRTAHIVGNFTNNGVLRTGVTDTQAGGLNVDGTVTLGGTLEVDASTLTAGHSYAPSNRISIISATSPVSGEFTAFGDNSVLFDFTPQIYAVPEFSAFGVELLLTSSGGGSGGTGGSGSSGGGSTVLGSVESTGNTPAIGAATVFDDLIADFSGNGTTGDTGMDQVMLTFAGFTSEQQVSDAVSQTLPLLVGGSQFAASAALTGINRVIQARQEHNRGLSSGDTFYGDRHVWLKPFGSWADQDDRKGVSGYESSTAGLALGADAVVAEATRLGVAFAYARADIEGNSSVAPSEADVDVYQLVGYGSHALADDAEINFQLGLGRNENDGRRELPAFGATARGDYSSRTAMAGLGYGRNMKLDDQTTLTPSVRADYSWIRDEDYTETGAGALNLSVGEHTTEELILAVDGKLTHETASGLTLTAKLGAGYDVINDRASVTAAFAGAPGAAFATQGLDPSPWLARGGLGIVKTTQSGLEISARYDAEYRSDFLNQTASVKLRWAF